MPNSFKVTGAIYDGSSSNSEPLVVIYGTVRTAVTAESFLDYPHKSPATAGHRADAVCPVPTLRLQLWRRAQGTGIVPARKDRVTDGAEMVRGF
jgi:hypothetical protein